jgi:hypothetical protein
MTQNGSLRITNLENWDLCKQVAEQLKTISNGKALQGKVDRLKAELEAFLKEKSAWTKEKKRVSKSNPSFEKKLDRQTTAKHALQQKMAEIALDRKRLGLEQSKQRQINAEDKQKTITEGKNELVRFNHKKSDKSKMADLKRKEDTKAKKLKTHAERIQVVSSDTLGTSRLNGGSFPSPAPNVQEAHAHLQQDAPLRLSRMTQVEQPVLPNAGGSEHNPAHAQSQEEDGPWRQSTITQAHAPQLEQPAANSEAGKEDLAEEPVVVLPPGLQACRGEDHKIVCFHKATGTFEASLDVMFQKKAPSRLLLLLTSRLMPLGTRRRLLVAVLLRLIPTLQNHAVSWSMSLPPRRLGRRRQPSPKSLV